MAIVNKLQNQYKAIYMTVMSLILMLFLNINQVYANNFGLPKPNSPSSGSALDSVLNIMYNFGTGLAVLIFGVSVVVVVWAGFKLATSEGELAVVDKAKKQIKYAGIGIGIAIFAFIIVEVFAEVYGIKDITSAKLR